MPRINHSAKIGAALLAYAWLYGCGSSGDAPVIAPPIAAKPNVIITFGSAPHMCLVALVTEQQGSAIPCAELVPFLKDELRLGTGSIYDTRLGTSADPGETAAATQSLQAAGYRFLGGHP